jgi:GNAT superfamily N-acetyltransferase
VARVTADGRREVVSEWTRRLQCGWRPAHEAAHAPQAPASADLFLTPGRPMGMLAFAIHPRLRDEPLDARALAHARGVAADWRAAGLAVDLVERLTPAGRQDGYVLTARSPTRVLRCECRGWRLRGWLSTTVAFCYDLGSAAAARFGDQVWRVLRSRMRWSCGPARCAR